MLKRAFDLSLATAGMLCLWPAFIVLSILIRLDSRGPVFFKQVRVGRRFRPFWIYKFRTMVSDAPRLGGSITAGNDPRITRVGRALRRTKLDELPQLLNVLKGDMSIVGPRPEVAEYVDRFHADYEVLLRLRPGMTDLASLTFRDEAALLAGVPYPEETYVSSILPDKLKLGKEYVRDACLTFDIALIAKTLAALWAPTLFLGRRRIR